jgi:uncharacterized protein YyaL (SSP411 family)
MAHQSTRPNRLAASTSPYLLQHADNPVDWHPWDAAALELARTSGKPILLSIGYSACHWCHVMAHESFEDAATAAVMNEHFVNIKVDREERPDLDRIYQIAHQMLTQRGGGWPLTMFLTHDDHQPFFGGTYFPGEPRHGLPAFRELLQRVAEYYRDQQTEIRAQNVALSQALADLAPPPAEPGVALTDAPLRAARLAAEQRFDRDWGGFGAAPKFPHPTTLERLLRDWRASAGAAEPDLQALYMTTLTLTRMGEGGLFDQLGGGFFRYSVDAYWMIPHFEKMLYDNGALLGCYAQAAVATGDAAFARIAAETADWLLRDLQDVDGGFHSSWDADSEGHEGRYYVWQTAEVRALLRDADQHAVFAMRFGLDREPNFEDESWHLHGFRSVADIASARGLDIEATHARLDTARATLLAARGQRVPPARDDKLLTAWNAIAIRGLAQAARALDRDDLESAASRALERIRRDLWRGGRLLATARGRDARLPAYLDDYALLADALLELAQLRWRSDEVVFARALLDTLLEHFEDRDAGGFFFTADDHEQLIVRSKSFADEATPSGNGVAALTLLRWGWLLGEPRWLAAAERTLRAGWRPLERYPLGHMSLATALDEYLEPPLVIVLRGARPTIDQWRRELDRLWDPRRLIIAVPTDAADLPDALASKPAGADGSPRAYVCHGAVCSEPLDSLDALARRLQLNLA